MDNAISLNILVSRTATRESTTALVELGRPIVDRPVPQGFGHCYHAVTVRMGYTPLQDERATVYVRAGERRDAEAVNRMGRPGAYVTTVDADGIREAIAQLRAQYGDLPVFDPAGLAS